MKNKMSEDDWGGRTEIGTTIVQLLLPILVGSGLVCLLFYGGLVMFAALQFTYFCAHICWVCAVACGWHGVEKEKAKFPKLATTFEYLFVISLIPLLGIVSALVSICIAFFFLDGIRIISQLVWAGFSLFFLSIIFGVLGGF